MTKPFQVSSESNKYEGNVTLTQNAVKLYPSSYKTELKWFLLHPVLSPNLNTFLQPGDFKYQS